jgi:hypothetical protein
MLLGHAMSFFVMQWLMPVAYSLIRNMGSSLILSHAMSLFVMQWLMMLVDHIEFWISANGLIRYLRHIIISFEHPLFIRFALPSCLCVMCRSPEEQHKMATLYKSEKRDEMVKEGYRIRGNSGDQWSDLLGTSMSQRSFKLANPMYYIP